MLGGGGGGGAGAGADTGASFMITTSPERGSCLKLMTELAALDTGEGFFLYFLASFLA